MPDKPGAVAHIFGPLAAASINVDMIIQNVGRDKGETDVTFTVPQADLRARPGPARGHSATTIGYNRMITDSKVAKISVVGVGMSSHAGVAATMFKALADRGINIQAISTSEIKVSRADRRGRDRAGGARAAHRLWAGRGGRGGVNQPTLSGEDYVGHAPRLCWTTAEGSFTRISASPAPC